MDNRGYGESDKPKHQRDYSVDKLADDVANLAKHLGRDKFILVGHDWGGAIGYEERICLIELFVATLILVLFIQVCRRHPDMVRAYIVCNCPHANAMVDEVKAGWEQRLRSWYMLFFQVRQYCFWQP